MSEPKIIRNRFNDFLAKCYVFGFFLLLVIAFIVSLTATTERRVMYRLLNYNRQTIIEKEKYFKLESVPEFRIYPLNENEFKVVFTNGKTVNSKNIVIAGIGDEGTRKVWEK